jgi:hypothetical protein
METEAKIGFLRSWFWGGIVLFATSNFGQVVMSLFSGDAHLMGTAGHVDEFGGGRTVNTSSDNMFMLERFCRLTVESKVVLVDHVTVIVGYQLLRNLTFQLSV